jgi:tRNA-dihydrouridine synthase
MIGRALWGCPWKMQEILCQARGETFSITLPEMISLALDHLKLNVKLYGIRGVQAFKKQLPQYIRGVVGAAGLRQRMLRYNDEAEMTAELEALRDQPEMQRAPFAGAI